MSEQPGKLGFQFIPNPEGVALTESELLRSAIAQQQEKDHQKMLLAFDLLGIAVICAMLIVVLFMTKRRTR